MAASNSDFFGKESRYNPPEASKGEYFVKCRDCDRVIGRRRTEDLAIALVDSHVEDNPCKRSMIRIKNGDLLAKMKLKNQREKQSKVVQ